MLTSFPGPQKESPKEVQKQETSETFNAIFWNNLLNVLLLRIQRFRPQIYRSRKWNLCHDKVRMNVAIR